MDFLTLSSDKIEAILKFADALSTVQKHFEALADGIQMEIATNWGDFKITT